MWNIDMMPFELISSSRGDADAKTPVFSRVDYSVCTIEYVESGRGFLEINGSRFEPEANSVYILAKHSTHRYWPKRDDPWKKKFIVVDGPMMEYLFHAYDLENVYHIPHCDRVKNLFSDLLALHAGTEEGNRKGALLFHELLSELSAVFYGNLNEKDSVIEKLKRTLDSSEKIRFHLAEYAANNGKSEAYLIREFRKQYSVSPYQYLLTRKLETARQLLRYSNLSIKEIAEQLCFSDQYYFSNCFKKIFGLSPKFFKQS